MWIVWTCHKRIARDWSCWAEIVPASEGLPVRPGVAADVVALAETEDEAKAIAEAAARSTLVPRMTATPC